MPRNAAAEVTAGITELRAHGVTTVTVVGLCSGGQISIRTLAAIGGADSVVGINALLFSLYDIGAGSPMRRFWALGALAMTKTKVRTVLQRIPEPIWVLLDRLSLLPAPTRYLREANARGIRVELIYGDTDKGIIDFRSRTRREFHRLVDRDQVGLLVIDGMDHSMFNRSCRPAVLDRIRDCCGIGAQAPAASLSLQSG
jgi:dienelactone hydrolase